MEEPLTHNTQPHPTTRMTKSIATFVTCPCDICGGENVKQSVVIKHERDAEQAERKAARKLGTPTNPSPSNCIENNVVLPRPNHGQRLLRSQIIDAMLKSAHPLELAEDNAGDGEDDGEDDAELYAGIDPHEEALESRVDDELHRDGAIGRNELRQIRKDIATTIRPGWQTGPPVKFGAPAHGKLTADQWRSCIEFGIPVPPVQLWASDGDESNHDRRQKLVESTMFLATALRWATSHRTSQKHRDEYMRNMRAYLKSLRDLHTAVMVSPYNYL